MLQSIYNKSHTENKCQYCEWRELSGIKSGNRTSTCVKCREAWAKCEQSKLYYADLRLPFTHHIRFTLCKDMSLDDNLAMLRQVLKVVAKFASNHKLTFDLKCFPERTKYGALHYHGVARLDKAVELKLRQAWKSVTGRGRGSYSIVVPKQDYSFMSYCVKQFEQHKYEPVIAQRKKQKLIVHAGNVYRTKASA